MAGTGIAGFRYFTSASGDPSIVEKDGEVFCDLGDVAQSGRVTRVIPVRNPTAAPLVVSEVVRGCDCVAARRDRREIPPGEAAALTLTMSTPDRLGGFSQRIQVVYAGGHPPTAVWLYGTVGAWVPHDPPEVQFGEVCPGDRVGRAAGPRCGPSRHRSCRGG